MNPIMQMINSTPAAQTATANVNPDMIQAAKQLKPLLQMVQSAKNPAEMMKQLCMQNPGFQQAYTAAQSIARGDPKGAFFAAARQQGIDPNALIEALSG